VNKDYFRLFFKIIEYGLALILFLAVCYFSFINLIDFLSKDWSDFQTYYQFITYILLALVGIELIRLLLFHSLSAVLELMIILIARKMFSPELDPLGMLFSSLALLVIIGIYYLYALKPLKSLQDLTQ
jgi:hypothetical protein